MINMSIELIDGKKHGSIFMKQWRNVASLNIGNHYISRITFEIIGSKEKHECSFMDNTLTIKSSDSEDLEMLVTKIQVENVIDLGIIIKQEINEIEYTYIK